MKPKTVMALALSLVASPSLLSAQQKTQEELAKLRDEKMALEVFQKADWIFDYDKAIAAAKERQQPIFAYFTRSYAG